MRLDACHPAIPLLLFAAAIVLAVRWNDPAALAIAWAGSLACSVALRGRRAWALAGAMAALAIAWAAIFAANEHFGATRIGTWIDGNALTAESVAAGFAQGVAAASVVQWASCALRVFTLDKVVYLAGRAAPTVALGLAVAARALPAFAMQVRTVRAARRGMGCGAGLGALGRAREAARAASAVATWAAERFASSTDAMRARGAGLRGRTAFSRYRFGNRDRALAVAVVAIVATCACGDALGAGRMLFDPTIAVARPTPAGCAFLTAYAALCLLPAALEGAGRAVARRRGCV